MAKVKENIEMVKKILKSDGLKYKVKDGVFFIPFRDENDVRMYQCIDVMKHHAVFISGIMECVKKDRIRDISERFMKLNTGLIHGAFLIDESGFIAYRSEIFNDAGKLRKGDVDFHRRMGAHMITNMNDMLEKNEIPPITTDYKADGEPMYS